MAATAVLVACGSDGDGGEGGSGRGETAVATGTRGPASATRTPSASSGTPDPRASEAARSPGAAAPTATTPPNSTGVTPRPAQSPSSLDATIAAGAGADVVGGDPSAPREPVGEVPEPPPGADIDPPDVAPPAAPDAGLQIIVDLDASVQGIQASRTVQQGDVIRVAVVAANVPADGLRAFNFFLDYDRGVLVAPSYTGGASTDRNPDLHEGALADGWTCLPAPEGDLDDAGGIEGDGDPGTGRALLSCFIAADGGPSGTLVLATVEFHAVSAGTTALTLAGVSLGGGPALIEFGRCENDITPGDVIPCVAGTATVQ